MNRRKFIGSATGLAAMGAGFDRRARAQSSKPHQAPHPPMKAPSSEIQPADAMGTFWNRFFRTGRGSKLSRWRIRSRAGARKCSRPSAPFRYTTRRRPSAPPGPYSLEFTGTRGSVRMELRFDPVLTLLQDGEWRPIAGDPTLAMSPQERERQGANTRIGDDWFAAIGEDRAADSSGYDGMKFVEMVHGVYAAALSRQPVAFPLKHRRHPLLG